MSVLSKTRDEVENIKDEFEKETGIVFTKETLEEAWRTRPEQRKSIFAVLIQLKGAHENYIEVLEQKLKK